MGTPNLAIDVRGLTKRFGRQIAVDGLSIQVPRGRICGFLGPNGSGKTTTIRMLCGLLTPDDGEGTCLGYDIRRQARAIKLRVGYMTQRFGLYEDLTIEENLRFIARVYGLADAQAAATRAVERLGLTERRAQLAGALSGGWKQRMALAACLLHDPDLLLLDEPTAGVDPKARRDFWAEIHKLAAAGLTVLVSTHYMDEAERCHQIAYISQGRLLVAGSADEILHAAKLRTWEVVGPGIDALAARLAAQPEWLTVPFGTRLHVVSDRGDDFGAWFAMQQGLPGCTVQEIASSLEDLFISLMQHGRDGLQ
ncbi:MAG: ABC transporter ATP-binding protein [Betaproteobacteria bacterium]